MARITRAAWARPGEAVGISFSDGVEGGGKFGTGANPSPEAIGAGGRRAWRRPGGRRGAEDFSAVCDGEAEGFDARAKLAEGLGEIDPLVGDAAGQGVAQGGGERGRAGGHTVTVMAPQRRIAGTRKSPGCSSSASARLTRAPRRRASATMVSLTWAESVAAKTRDAPSRCEGKKIRLILDFGGEVADEFGGDGAGHFLRRRRGGRRLCARRPPHRR